MYPQPLKKKNSEHAPLIERTAPPVLLHSQQEKKMEWEVGRSPADLLSCTFLIPVHAAQKRWEPTFLQHCIESNSLGLLGYTDLLGCSQQWRHPSSEWRNHWEQHAVKLQLLPATCLSLNNAWICQKHSLEAATQYLPAKRLISQAPRVELDEQNRSNTQLSRGRHLGTGKLSRQGWSGTSSICCNSPRAAQMKSRSRKSESSPWCFIL